MRFDDGAGEQENGEKLRGHAQAGGGAQFADEQRRSTGNLEGNVIAASETMGYAGGRAGGSPSNTDIWSSLPPESLAGLPPSASAIHCLTSGMCISSII